MKKNLSEAVSRGDVIKVRSILLDLLRNDAGRKETLITVAETMAHMPGLFEEPSGPLYTLPSEEWNDSYARSVEEALVRNFTRDRLSHYSEVMVELSARGRRGENTQVAAAAFGGVAEPVSNSAEKDDDPKAMEELLTGRYTEIVAPADTVDLSAAPTPVEKAVKDHENPAGNHRLHPAVIAGYGLMALGLVAAIVSLCVPVKFLLGLGIGVLMIGSAVTYAGLTAPSRKSRR